MKPLKTGLLGGFVKLGKSFAFSAVKVPKYEQLITLIWETFHIKSA